MSEYEIFNNGEENIKIIPEPKKNKKSKRVTVKEKAKKKECACSQLFKKYFNMAYLPIFLSSLAIFFSLFVQFLPIFGIGGVLAASAFFFVGFTCVFAALIIETVNMFRTNEIQVNVNLILILLAFFVLFI